jgi:hypothetical protein
MPPTMSRIPRHLFTLASALSLALFLTLALLWLQPSYKRLHLRYLRSPQPDDA